MNTWLIVAAVILVGFAFLKFFKARKKKKSCISVSTRKHPTGFIKYHDKTQTHIKRQLVASNNDGNKSNNKNAAKEKNKEVKNVCAVLRYKGDIKASGRSSFSHLVDECILNKEKINEVVVVVESPGGSVMEYGYLYGEMLRLRENIKELTCCVDTVAASGGYLMAIPAHKIVAAPFAMVGSIGVVSFVPNVREMLEKLNIKPRTFTAGNYKRTVTMTDDASEEDIKVYKEHLDLIHKQFLNSLTKHRPQCDLKKVGTGEAWLAQSSVDLGLKLVDEIGLSTDYLLKKNSNCDLLEFKESFEKPLRSRILKHFFKQAQSFIN